MSKKKRANFGTIDFDHYGQLVDMGYPIKPADYLYLEQVGNMQKDPSRGFWCTMSNAEFIKKFRFTDSGLRTMQRRLAKLGLYETQEGNKTGKRATALFFNPKPYAPSESDARQKVTGSPSESDAQPRQKVTGSPSESDDERNKGKEKKKEKKETAKEKTPFQHFFSAFDEKVGISAYWKSKKKKACLERTFNKMGVERQREACAGIERYLLALKARQAKQPDLVAVNPETYLDGERWNDKAPEVANPLYIYSVNGAVKKTHNKSLMETHKQQFGKFFEYIKTIQV